MNVDKEFLVRRFLDLHSRVRKKILMIQSLYEDVEALEDEISLLYAKDFNIPLSPAAPALSEVGDQPESNHGMIWTQDELLKLREAVKLYGPREYEKMAEYVGTRNARAIKGKLFRMRRKGEEL